MDDNKFIIDTMKEVLEKTEETRGCIQKLDRKMDLHIQKTELELGHIGELDAKQNQLLEEHSARSDRLEKDNVLREATLKQEFDDRFQKIEKPREWLKITGKLIIYVGSAAGAIYGVYEFVTNFILK